MARSEDDAAGHLSREVYTADDGAEGTIDRGVE
jgi:hypothetical protein